VKIEVGSLVRLSVEPHRLYGPSLLDNKIGLLVEILPATYERGQEFEQYLVLVDEQIIPFDEYELKLYDEV